MEMEMIRHKRYKVASNADRSSGERFSPVNRGLRAGYLFSYYCFFSFFFLNFLLVEKLCEIDGEMNLCVC